MRRIKIFLLMAALFIVSRNAQAQWVQTGISGYDSVYCLLANGSNLFAGTDSGLYVSVDSGANWTKVDSGLPNSGVSALAADSANMFAGTGSGVYRSTDSGVSWAGVFNAKIIALAANGTNVFASYNNYVDMSPNNGSYWRGADAGLPSGNWVLAFLINGTEIFAGTEQGVYVSKDSGASWSADTIGMAYPPFGICPWVYSFTMIGTNIFAATSLGVYLSTDNGSSWSRVIGGLIYLLNRVYALTSSGSNVFAASDSGVFLSSNSGANWSSVDTGMPYGVHINTLAISGGYLFAGTAGAGVWRRPLSEIIAVKYGAPEQKKAVVLHIDNNNILRYVLSKVAFVSLKIYDLRGRLVATAINEMQSAGTHTVLLKKGRYSAGSYIADFSAGDFKTRKIFAFVR